jgi:hypothetical protein
MNFCRLRNSEKSMESPPTSLANGSRAFDSEQTMADQARMHSPEDLSASVQADTPALTSGFGMPAKRPPFWTGVDTQEPTSVLGPYSILLSGNVGQEIVDPDGKVIAWTTDQWVAQVIVKLLTENEGLLG